MLEFVDILERKKEEINSDIECEVQQKNSSHKIQNFISNAPNELQEGHSNTFYRAGQKKLTHLKSIISIAY